MGGEERLDRFPAAALARGPAHEAVGVHAAGGAADALEAELDLLGAADLGDGGVEAPGAVLAAELPQHVVGAGHAKARHVWVEQEAAPGQVE